jgi:hypothetical protein
MAIKIKRDVNATAAAYGSMAGGKGKRQVEDARILASLARQGGGGSTMGAQARADARILSAPSPGGAPLGSVGGTISRQPNRTVFSGVSSPGGFKRQAQMTDDELSGYTMKKGGTEKNPVYYLKDANGRVVQRYSAGQYESLQRRGGAGASLNRFDQAAYFRSQGGRTKSEQALDARIAEQDFRAAEAQKARDEKQRLAAEERAFQLERDRQRNEVNARIGAEERAFQLERDSEQRAFKERLVDEDLNRQSESESGFSAEQRMARREIRRKIDSIRRAKNVSKQQWPAANEKIAELEAELNGMKPENSPTPDLNNPSSWIQSAKAPDGSSMLMIRRANGSWEPYTPERQPRTGQDILNSGFDYNGVHYVIDGNGRPVPLEDPNARANLDNEKERTKYIATRIQQLLAESRERGEAAPHFATLAKQAESEFAIISGKRPTRSRAEPGSAAPTQRLTAEEAKKKFLVSTTDTDKKF